MGHSAFAIAAVSVAGMFFVIGPAGLWMNYWINRDHYGIAFVGSAAWAWFWTVYALAGMQDTDKLLFGCV